MAKEQILEKKNKTKISRDPMKIGIIETEKKIESIRIIKKKNIKNLIGKIQTIIIKVENENKDKYYKKTKEI